MTPAFNLAGAPPQIRSKTRLRVLLVSRWLQLPPSVFACTNRTCPPKITTYRDAHYFYCLVNISMRIRLARGRERDLNSAFQLYHRSIMQFL